MTEFDIAVVGAGAAGLAAAIFAAETARKAGRPLRIVLIDGAKKPGAKILVSGGGRCNVTHETVGPEDYCGGSSKIIRNVLRAFDESSTLDWMARLGVDLKLEDTGKYFPVTDSARTVLDGLLNRIDALGVEKCFGWRVGNILPPGSPDEPWTIVNGVNHATLLATKVILATGGQALPKSGSDGASYAWLRRLGHSIVPTVPALAPLVLDERGFSGSPLSRQFSSLSGISLTARLDFVAEGRSLGGFTGSVLFTHFGLSGPAAMNISRHCARYRKENQRQDEGHLTLGLSQFPEVESADKWLLEMISQRPRASVANVLKDILPERLAVAIVSEMQAERTTDLGREERQRLARLLSRSPLAVKGDRGYTFAEATAGGVALEEISWKTMKSRKADNLYLCGEVLDVDGRIGGFNFQWAWASGFIAGKSAAAGSPV